MKKGCSEHRNWMELIELQRKLERSDLDAVTRIDIEKRIEILRKELDVE